MQTLGVISNPYNRASRRDPLLHQKLARVLGGRGILKITRTLEELSETVAEFQSKGITRIAVVGGDGSINLLLENVLRFYEKNALPQVLILRGGTANVLAFNLGIRGSPARVLEKFLTPEDKAPLELSIQSLYINGRIGFQFANGVAARFLQLFYQNKGSIAQAGTLLAQTTLRTLLPRILSKKNGPSLTRAVPMVVHAEPALPSTIGSDNSKYSIIFVSTIPKMAMGIPIFPSLGLGEFRADILATGIEDRCLARLIFRAVARLPLDHPKVHTGTLSKAHIATPKGEPYTIDGELFDAPEEGVNIELGPRFRFALP